MARQGTSTGRVSFAISFWFSPLGLIYTTTIVKIGQYIYWWRPGGRLNRALPVQHGVLNLASNVPYLTDLEPRAPFTGPVPEKMKDKVKTHGKDLLSPWMPQQLILRHPGARGCIRTT